MPAQATRSLCNVSDGNATRSWIPGYLEKIRVRIGMRGGVFLNRVGFGGGLALLWSDKVEVVLKTYSSSHTLVF